MVSDIGAGMLVLDGHGKIVHINGVGARIYARRSAKEATGLRLSDLLPPAAANERLESVRMVLNSGEPLILRDLWAGLALRCVIRRVDSFADIAGPLAVLVCSHEGALLEETADQSGMRTIDVKHVDLGPLAELTTSELKVLALIGEGLSNAEIAARLHRAVKTVESHRAALTDKTGTASRVQLGLMARRAGLAKRVGLVEPMVQVQPTAARVLG